MEWVAKTVTYEGIAPTEEKDAPLRYLKSATCGPGFRCSTNDRKPCAWGAVKVMIVFSKLPSDRTTWRTRPNSAPTALAGDAPHDCPLCACQCQLVTARRFFVKQVLVAEQPSAGPIFLEPNTLTGTVLRMQSRGGEAYSSSQRWCFPTAYSLQRALCSRRVWRLRMILATWPTIESP